MVCFLFLFRARLQPLIAAGDAATVWAWGAFEAACAWRGGVSLKPGIKLFPSAIDFGSGVLLALDFNRDKFLCAFF